jgi:ABC-type microcin C transport system duplicated ATPase subunit YejF
VRGLVKEFLACGGSLFGARPPLVQAVSSEGFDLLAGETLGLVGESGCGKSTLARCLLRLIDPTAGEIGFRNTDISRLDTSAMRPLRRQIQIVFQDPFGSLHPRMRPADIIGEPLRLLGFSGAERRARSSCFDRCGYRQSMQTASRMSSQEDNANASASPGRWRCGRRLSSLTDRFPPSTFQFRSGC